MAGPPADFHAGTGITPLKNSPGYSTYRSAFGPKYKIPPNVNGWTAKSVTRLGLTLGAFGGVAGFFALFFFGDVPKVRKDILQKLPIIGNHFVKEIPPSDNPF